MASSVPGRSTSRASSRSAAASLDVFPPGEESPLRLDFFGETLEAVRRFDTATQRTIGDAREIVLNPMSEAPLDKESIQHFRSGYLAASAPSPTTIRSTRR